MTGPVAEPAAVPGKVGDVPEGAEQRAGWILAWVRREDVLRAATRRQVELFVAGTTPTGRSPCDQPPGLELTRPAARCAVAAAGPYGGEPLTPFPATTRQRPGALHTRQQDHVGLGLDAG